jgi:hypothetical protein
MEAYHKIVLAVASLTLILFLLTLGFMIPRDKSSDPWPPVAGRCPDGWTEDANTLNLCKPPSNGFNMGLLNKGTPSVDFNKNYTTICDKWKWAKIKNGIQWDGVSNYNKCN